jgi:hypothetical protein
VEFATACSKFQPQVLLLDCTACIGGNYNPKQQNPSILSSPSCTHKAHLGKQCLSSPSFPVKDNTLRRLDTNVLIKYIFHKNREISILTIKKTARLTLPQEATERTKQGETTNKTKNKKHTAV